LTLQQGPLPITGVLGDVPSSGWADDFDQLVFKGSPLLSEVIFLHKHTRTLILDDLIQANSVLESRPFRNAFFKLDGALAPHGGVAHDIRLSFTNRSLARQSLEQVLAWDFDRLIIAHGACIEKDAKLYVERAFYWLSQSNP